MTIILTIILLLSFIFLPYIIGDVFAKKQRNASTSSWYEKWGFGFVMLFILLMIIVVLAMCIAIAHRIALNLSPHLQTLINNLNKPL
jgi:hypothetical protein